LFAAEAKQSTQFGPGKKESMAKTAASDGLSMNHSSVLLANLDPMSAAAMRA